MLVEGVYWACEGGEGETKLGSSMMNIEVPRFCVVMLVPPLRFTGSHGGTLTPDWRGCGFSKLKLWKVAC